MSQEKDPLAVIAQDAPAFSDQEAREIIRQRYGLDVTTRPLVSERDQNFRLEVADGRKLTLKIANSEEPRAVTQFQIEALRHIAKTGAGVLQTAVPAVVPTLEGAHSFVLERNGSEHVARVVTYLDGAPLAQREASPALARHMGECLAGLGLALRDFEHPGSGQSLLWDVQRALDLRPLIDHVRDAAQRQAVASALNDFETHVLPNLDKCRVQVIHSDLNPDNALVDGDRLVGIIDFGDMLSGPLVIDAAVACSYFRVATGDPLFLIAEFVAGYSSVVPFAEVELDLFFDLLQARLCASTAILEWRASERGDADPYLAKLDRGEGSAGHFLLRLRELPRDHVRRVLGQIAAGARGVTD